MISGGLFIEETAEENAGFVLTSFEADTIGEILNISMGSAATAISSLLDRRVLITTPRVSTSLVSEIEYAGLEPAMCVEITYVEGISGSNVMVFKQQDMAMILDVLMGREPTDPSEFVFDEIAISAACEVMNQMMGASATALSNFLGMSINISTPTALLQEKVQVAENLRVDPNDTVTVVRFDLEIDGVTSTEFASVLTVDLTKTIISRMLGDMTEEPAPPPPPPQVAPPEPIQPIQPLPMMEPPPAMPTAIPMLEPMPQMMPQMQPPQEQPQMMPQMMPQMQPQMQPQMMPQMQQPMMQQPMMQQPMMMQQQPTMYGGMGTGAPINAKNVVLEQFPAHPALDSESLSNLDMILSVPMQVTVEIGKAQKRIKEILEFTQGTIVELDKQAGAPVDIIVNGQPVARGDVVVIDDSFAVRITEILKGRDFLEKL